MTEFKPSYKCSLSIATIAKVQESYCIDIVCQVPGSIWGLLEIGNCETFICQSANINITDWIILAAQSSEGYIDRSEFNNFLDCWLPMSNK